MYIYFIMSCSRKCTYPFTPSITVQYLAVFLCENKNHVCVRDYK